MNKEKLSSLVAKAQEGNNQALNDLFTETYNDVYYFALKTVKDETLAADITQETFVTIFKNINSLSDPVAYPAWSRQITYRQCLQYLKKQNRETTVEENEDGSTIFDIIQEDREDFIPDKNLDKEDFKKTILEIVDSLPEEQRTAIILYYYDELTVNQIAEIQSVTSGTVKSRLNYARKAIKSSVENYENKNNIKLHSVGILPLLLWLFRTDAEACSLQTATATTIASGVSAATGTTVSVSKLVPIASKFLGALWQKIVAGVVMMSIAVGGVFIVENFNNKSQEIDETQIQAIQSDESKTEDEKPKEPIVQVWQGQGKITVGLNLSSENEFIIKIEQTEDDTVKGNLTVVLFDGSSYERTFTGKIRESDDSNSNSLYYDIELNEEVEKYFSNYPGYTKLTLICDKENDTLQFSWDAPYDATLIKK